MRSSFLLFVFAFATNSMLLAQTFVQISTGEGYENQAFYTLSERSSIEVDNESWDLVFTTFGQQDAGIHINEASSSTFGMPAPTVELYRTDATELSEITAFDTLFTRVYNDEGSWAFGAFNNDRDFTNFFDFGWGSYNPATRTVTGNEVFVIKLRSGEFKKIKIESLALTTYNIAYANLDGSELTNVSFDKINYPTGLAYFSFAAGGVVELPANTFDLLFTRYVTPVFDPESGDTLDYTVTGILSAPGIEVAKITGIPSSEVTTASLSEDFSNRIDAIGYDWKTFDFMGGWIIEDSTTYIVKTPGNELYKLVFIDFEGSTTGVATFEQTELNDVSNIKEVNSAFESLNTFPNPAARSINVVYSLKEVKALTQIRLFNLLGQEIWTTQTQSIKGLNATELQLPPLASGQYLLSVQMDDSIVTQKITIHQ